MQVARISLLSNCKARKFTCNYGKWIYCYKLKIVGILKSRKWKWNGNWTRKMEMEIGNENIKVASLLAVGVFLLACYSYTSGALPVSSLASVGTSNAAIGSSLFSFPGLPSLQFCILQVISSRAHTPFGKTVAYNGLSCAVCTVRSNQIAEFNYVTLIAWSPVKLVKQCCMSTF